MFTRAGEGFHTHTKGENHLLVTREPRRSAVIHRNQQEEEQKMTAPADRRVEVEGGTQVKHASFTRRGNNRERAQ